MPRAVSALKVLPTVLALALPLGGVSVLVGCPSDAVEAPPPDAGFDATSVCPTGFLGDPEKEPIVELRALRAEGTDVPLKDGDDLALIFPPQGGRVAFVGVRATNLDGCGVQIFGALRDPATQRVQLDGRTVNLRKEPDGWGSTGRGTTTDLESSEELGDYANIPLCPNQWASQDLYDKPFEVELKLTDRRDKTVTMKAMVTPRCAEPGAKETSCRCMCKQGHRLGESCGEDGGVEAGPK